MIAKAEATERSLKAEQYKILDLARALLFLREKITSSDDLKDSFLADAVAFIPWRDNLFPRKDQWERGDADSCLRLEMRFSLFQVFFKEAACIRLDSNAEVSEKNVCFEQLVS